MVSLQPAPPTSSGSAIFTFAPFPVHAPNTRGALIPHRPHIQACGLRALALSHKNEGVKNGR